MYEYYPQLIGERTGTEGKISAPGPRGGKPSSNPCRLLQGWHFNHDTKWPLPYARQHKLNSSVILFLAREWKAETLGRAPRGGALHCLRSSTEPELQRLRGGGGLRGYLAQPQTSPREIESLELKRDHSRSHGFREDDDDDKPILLSWLSCATCEIDAFIAFVLKKTRTLKQKL